MVDKDEARMDYSISKRRSISRYNFSKYHGPREGISPWLYAFHISKILSPTERECVAFVDFQTMERVAGLIARMQRNRKYDAVLSKGLLREVLTVGSVDATQDCAASDDDLAELTLLILKKNPNMHIEVADKKRLGYIPPLEDLVPSGSMTDTDWLG